MIGPGNIVGCIDVFNMMLGTGALTMPYVFAKAGWVIGLAVITLLCAIAYVQLTFLIEALPIPTLPLRWTVAPRRREMK